MADPRLIDAVRGAAQRRPMPGGVDWRILFPDAVGDIAVQLETDRRAVELAALDSEIVPLHYLRNISRFAIRGQITLLESSAAVVAVGGAAQKCLEILAAAGVGELRVLAPPNHGVQAAERRAAHARNLNASVMVTVGALELRRGNPVEALRGVGVVAACLEDAMDEMLLQTACRRLSVPFVCGGVLASQGQATTILPGDPGVAQLYRPEHPHLAKERPGSLMGEGKAPAVVGAWLAEQTLALLLGHGDLLRGQLLFADLYEGLLETYALPG